MQDLYFGGCCDDEQTLNTISAVYKKYNYLSDTHTAVALNVCDKYLNETNDTRPLVVASTASPYKFSPAVLKAVTGDKTVGDEFSTVNALYNATGVAVPAPLSSLKGLKPRFNNLCDKTDMAEVVLNNLK